jgi:hypothetical protein
MKFTSSAGSRLRWFSLFLPYINVRLLVRILISFESAGHGRCEKAISTASACYEWGRLPRVERLERLKNSSGPGDCNLCGVLRGGGCAVSGCERYSGWVGCEAP